MYNERDAVVAKAHLPMIHLEIYPLYSAGVIWPCQGASQALCTYIPEMLDDVTEITLCSDGLDPEKFRELIISSEMTRRRWTATR